MGKCELEILLLVPGEGIGLGHRRALPLAVDLEMAILALG